MGGYCFHGTSNTKIKSRSVKKQNFDTLTRGEVWNEGRTN